MIVAGFVLLVLSVVVGAGAAVGGHKTAKVDLGFFDVSMTSSAVFFTGVVTALVFLFGLSLLKRGLKRSHKRRKDLRQLEKMRGELDSMRKVEDDKPADELRD